MSDHNSSDGNKGDSSEACCQRKFSLTRLLILLVPAALIAIVGSQMLGTKWQEEAQQELQQDTLARMLGPESGQQSPAGSFADGDGDGLPDSPPDAECLSPDELSFSFIAASDDRDQASVWKEFIAALGEKLGRPVNYVHYSTQEDQMAALASGDLQITVLNTGAVPTAVKSFGFVPACTFGQPDGSYGYTMKIIVPAGSDIKTAGQLKGHKITFTRPTSNSGFKAPLVLLMNEFEMLPERDYQWGFSLDHNVSIMGVVNGLFEAAPIASDVLDRLVARGEVDRSKLVEIHESKRFPPASVGYLCNLSSELRDGIRQTLLEFDWAGTGLEDEFGAGGKFVAVNYKEDWAATQQVDQAVDDMRANLAQSPATTAKH